MSNPWFRLYHEFASDPKVQSMSEVMQRRLVMLFCLRCSDALVTLHVTEIAFALRINSEELEETRKLFLAKNFINEDWEIVNWEKRQFPSDSSRERVRAFRERQKKSKTKKCNVTVTAQNRTEQNIKDKKKIIQKKKTPKKPKKKAPIKEPENFTPPDWIPNEDWQAFVEMRKNTKKPMTHRAKELLVMRLDEFREKGQSPAKVLQQSIMGNYQGVFEIKPDKFGKREESHAGVTSKF